ncbi:MAG: glycosyltransferase family 2 protein [Chloroflexi bacterium]|nr:glycosyltransferase family 2 protein [Chloroflexota bacterium]
MASSEQNQATVSAPDTGVVIVNYRVPALLADCLTSLAGSSARDRLVACVVDSASGDGSVARLMPQFPDTVFLELDRNLGYPRANNVGVAHLRDRFPDLRYMLFLNPDTVVPASALSNLLRVLERFPGAGAAGPRLELADGSIDWACRRGFPTPLVSLWHMARLGRLLPRSRLFGRYRLTFLDERAVAEVDALAGACMLVRCSVLDEIGLFDETFFMYGEDIDLCYRMQTRGWRVIYDGSIDVRHLKRASSRQNPRAQREFVRAMRVFYEKHYARDMPGIGRFAVEAGLTFLNLVQRFRSGRREITA